jgi:hypothetical protein
MREWSKEWFETKFFDIRKHRPKKGQVLARYRATADFVDAWVKRNVITLLSTGEAGAESARAVLRNMCGAIEVDSIKVALEMAKDLRTMTVEEVAAKDYRMVVEYNYWTEKENIPENDPHWTTINLLNKDEIDEKIKFNYHEIHQ